MRATWILVALLAVGCSGVDEAPEGSATPNASAESTGGADGRGSDGGRGTIRGVVTMRGGPAGQTFQVDSGTLHVVGAGVNETHALADDGSFEVTVPVGGFDVYATVPQYNNGARCWRPRAGEVLVRRGEASEVQIVCPLR